MLQVGRTALEQNPTMSCMQWWGSPAARAWMKSKGWEMGHEGMHGESSGILVLVMRQLHAAHMHISFWKYWLLVF